MDPNVSLIADYAHALRFEDLSPEAVHHCKRCMVDTMGCALGAYAAEPSRIAREIACRAGTMDGARVIGTTHRTLPELAAFANGVMGRYLDGNDTFNSGGGHPSDTIAAMLAAADAARADGRTVITAIVLAYEVYHNLFTSIRVFEKGVDHAFYTAVAGAVGAAKVLGLKRDAMAHAASLAITPNITLATTRYGQLSMWKGCAGGNAARNGVFAALLAAAGMTGPDKPLDGEHGLQGLMGPFGLSPFRHGEFAITGITLKYFASVAQSLSPITVALPLSRELDCRDIEAVTLYTYRFALEVTGQEREKWRPATREAADHSLPYIVAAVLVAREFTHELFSDAYLGDPRILDLINRIEISEDPDFTRRFPTSMPCRIEVKTRNGGLKVRQTENARGHFNNPMTDDEINAKFRDLAGQTLSQRSLDQALSALWQIDSARNLDSIFEATRVNN